MSARAARPPEVAIAFRLPPHRRPAPAPALPAAGPETAAIDRRGGASPGAAASRSRQPGCPMPLASRMPRAPAGRIEEALDRPGQTRLGQVAHDPGPLDQADLAVLLGDHDDHRIGLLGDPEGRAVARPEPLGVDGRLGERQERPGGHDLVLADDHRAIVQGGPRREDRLEQVGGDVAVDHDPALGHLLEARSRARARSVRRGPRPTARRRPGRPRARPARRRGSRRARTASQTTRPARSARGPAEARAGRSRRGRTARRPRPAWRIWVSSSMLKETASA